MSKANGSTPRPRRRLLKTLLKWPRNVRAFAPRIATDEVLGNRPDLAEAAHWGEVALLEDFAVALHRDGTASWLTHVITAPHGDQNLAEWDDVTRLFDQRKMRPTIRRAVTYMPDGSQRKAKKVVAPLNAHERVMKLTYAPLRPGVIVELEMQEDEFVPDPSGPGLWANFSLQWLWPCRRRRITVAVAKPFEATIQLHHCQLAPDESHERGYHVYRWDLRDVDGIEADMWTPPPRDFAPWVDISTLPNWRPVVKHYRKELLPVNGIPPPIKELARELSGTAATDRDKLFSVYRYATRDVRYGRHPSELEVATIRDASKMLEDLRGDCKDKSSLMVSLLGEMNIPAKVAVLLTAMNGRTPMLPSRRFDHAIVMAQVDGREIWLDPAGGPYTFGDLPQNDQGVKALILDTEEAHFVDVPRDEPAQQQVERLCEGRLDEAGHYVFQARVTACGERAALYRITLQDRNADHRRRTIQQAVADERPGAEVDEVEVGDVEDLSREVHYGYRVNLKQWARRIQDLLLFRIPWAEPMEFSGPVSAAERLQPLQMPPVMRLVERHEIQIPAGFTGYGLPYQQDHESPWCGYSLQVTCEGSRLVCQRRMESRGGIVSTDRFTEFKRFWEACARADQTDVVLMKLA